MGYRENRRKNYFIDKTFQAKFILKFCVLLISTSLLIGVLIYYFNQSSTTVAFENLRVVVKTTSDFILPIMLEILIIVTLLTAIATIVVTLFTSHKIAGPLYKLKIELEKMRNGNLSSQIRIRSTDQLQVVATDFNEFRMGLNDSVSTIKNNWKSIKEHCLKNNCEANKEIEYAINKIDAELSRYKTK